MQDLKPLDGIRVVERASGVAAAYAGRLLAAMGAEVFMAEPPEHSPLRREAPFLPGGGSALFAYLAADKRSVLCDLGDPEGREAFHGLVAAAQILIDDTPVADRAAQGLDPAGIVERHPHLVHLSVLPFGAEGPKAGWAGAEINLIHAGGEGFLLPNGLSADLFPDRPPLKIAGHFAEMQGGVTAALAALSALWSGQGQFVDVSVQDANVAIGAFAVQRYGDGAVEHRTTRSFRYGGVIECRDGFVELLTLEERQWQRLVDLLGRPDWATDPALTDSAERSARGDMINANIRAWAKDQSVADLVARAQELGVPMAPYNTPQDILEGGQETAREIFREVAMPGEGRVQIQSAPFRFGPEPLSVTRGAPKPGADQQLLMSCVPPEARRVQA
ncbi:CoA transferase [Psychromarinibacter sp. C21-152]|uniref:CoA transferase n=1 Tax=Psychromarinibacter sediminicola TaxID=3033385 RepID=A0AAE3T7L5_9RHOB|nr:CoA transferase [Psychromarinibacter sediminicola]MDF0599139.1 CoA transferase [Psychromarinibacter sediminicola]